MYRGGLEFQWLALGPWRGEDPPGGVLRGVFQGDAARWRLDAAQLPRVFCSCCLHLSPGNCWTKSAWGKITSSEMTVLKPSTGLNGTIAAFKASLSGGVCRFVGWCLFCCHPFSSVLILIAYLARNLLVEYKTGTVASAPCLLVSALINVSSAVWLRRTAG